MFEKKSLSASVEPLMEDVSILTTPLPKPLFATARENLSVVDTELAANLDIVYGSRSADFKGLTPSKESDVMADIQIEAKSSENERRSLKKECTDMKLISSGLKISCNKCKESFKTAGLMRRHQRLGCENQNRGKNSCEHVVQGGSNKK